MKCFQMPDSEAAERPSGLAAGWPVLKTYEGASLAKVKMPLGGIGTGTVSLSGRGGLVDWELMNAPAKGFTPRSRDWPPCIWPHFTIRTKAGDQVAARLLEGPLEKSEYEGSMGSAAPNHNIPRFGHAAFRAAYPLAEVELRDAAVPVDVDLQAMNPLVPNDSTASGRPAVLLRWVVRNPGAAPVDVSICGTMVNFCGEKPGRFWFGRDVERTEEKWERGDLLGIVLAGRRPASPASPYNGEIALSVPRSAGDVSRASVLREPGAWGVAMDRWWRRFLERGDVADTVPDSTSTENPHVAQLSVRVTLAPGERKEIPFVLSWRFPNRLSWQARPEDANPEERVGNWYATRWASAPEAATDFWKHGPEEEEKTVVFVNGILSAKAPAVVREAALFNLSTLRSETCFRTEDGNFYGWEGCADSYGSCFGNCTHVWGYEHCLVDLWPDLARSMLENEFGPQLDARGHMAFRVGLPLSLRARGEGTACADGQMQTLVKAREYAMKTRDFAWLAEWWPRIRLAMEFCWIAGGWDADRDGVMEGCQHNTMDVEYFGPNPQMEFLYLAALKACADMARRARDDDFAETCLALYANGREWTEANLFNGRYYEHRIVPPKGAIAEGLRHAEMGAKDLSDPDFQLGSGCLVDQLVGDYASFNTGLGFVADPIHANRTLDTILDVCRRKPDDSAFNPMRSYVLGDETSLKMAWYPDGRMPRSPFPYYRETMTGFEYVVAANLANRKRFAEAEAVVAAIRDRYDGVKRNPFDEAECGHHYARALAAWTVYRSFADSQQDDGSNGRGLHDPRIDGPCTIEANRTFDIQR